VFQQEQQILDLQAVNEELNHKIKKYHLNNNRINRPTRKFNCIIQQKYDDNNSNLNNAKSLYDEDLDEDISYDNDLDIFRVNIFINILRSVCKYYIVFIFIFNFINSELRRKRKKNSLVNSL
jgi:hypothetical protein